MQRFASKNFVAGLHVRELQVGGNIGEERQHAVGHVVPEVVHALRPAEKSRPIDHVRATVNDRLEQLAVVARVVLQVRVLHQDDVARRFRESAA